MRTDRPAWASTFAYHCISPSLSRAIHYVHRPLDVSEENTHCSYKVTPSSRAGHLQRPLPIAHLENEKAQQLSSFRVETRGTSRCLFALV